MFQFIVVAIALQLYFIIDYVVTSSQTLKMKQFIAELNYTMSVEPALNLQHNLLKSYILEPQIPAQNMYSLLAAGIQQTQASLIATLLERDHLANEPQQAAGYNSLFDEVMRQNPCNVIANTIGYESFTDCKAFSYDLLTQGIYIATTDQLANFQHMLQLIQFYTQPQNLLIPFQNNDRNIPLFPFNNNQT